MSEIEPRQPDFNVQASKFYAILPHNTLYTCQAKFFFNHIVLCPLLEY